MEILTKLTPAETYLLRDGNTASYQNLLKYTLVDLLFKKVLKSVYRTSGSEKDDKVHYIAVGENYSSYKPKVHEQVFLSAFTFSRDLEVIFDQLIKMGFQNGGGERRFIFRHLFKSTHISTCVKNSFFKRLFATIELNEEGKSTKTKIISALDKLEKEYPKLLDENKEAANEILNKIGGNIFLLKSFKFELLAKIDSEIDRQLQNEGIDRDIEDSFLMSFIYFDAFSDAFDESYDSFDSLDSGCSTDSGCSGGYSGCSGCSGCGGCGG